MYLEDEELKKINFYYKNTYKGGARNTKPPSQSKEKRSYVNGVMIKKKVKLKNK